MPIYEYRCEQGHTFEVMQRMTDDPISVCNTCDAPVERVFHPVAVHFKGSGFYTTDYGRKRSKESGESDSSKDASGSDSKESRSDSKSDSKPESKSETKAAASSSSD
jgi:putative FmdB family regulatory protein